jgi:Spy/CpxP family protein refolding chaperone
MKRSIVVIALLVAPLAARIDAQGPPGGGGGQGQGQGPDPFARHLFPPELVMQHQGQINLQDSQRAALQAAIQQAQTRFVDAQWKISAEGEKLARLLQTPTVDEKQVLEQVDRILDIEREVKRAQMGLMVRIKNTLTPPQQAKLRELRGSE